MKVSEDSELRQDFDKVRQEIQKMGKDIESCFCTLIEQIREEFDHLSQGIQQAFLTLQETFTGASIEVDDLKKPEIEEPLTNAIFFV